MTDDRNAIKQVTLQSLIYYHVLSRSNLEHRIADRCEWKACSGLTSAQHPSPSLVTFRTPSSNLLEGQRGDEGQLVVRSGGVGGEPPCMNKQRCAHRRGRAANSVPGEYLFSLRNHIP